MKEDGDYDDHGEIVQCPDYVARLVVNFAKKYKKWMRTSFNIIFVDCETENEIYLTGLPACFGQQYLPDVGRLPHFFVALTRDVEWGDFDEFNMVDAEEQKRRRVETFCRVLASLFAFSMDEEELSKDQGFRQNSEWKVEHVIAPLLKSSFLPQKSMYSDGTVVMVTKLERLYKVFERC